MIGIKDFDMPSCCNSCGHWSFNRDDEPLCDLTYECIRQFDKRQNDCPLVEAIPKDQYEARLKADMVDILLDVQNEIKQKELEAWDYPNIEFSKGLKLTVDIIQKKICALKESKNE